MAATNGTPAYTVDYLDGVLTRLKALAERAVASGVGPAFAADLRRMDERLRHAPGRWGDPQFDYHHLEMKRYCGRLPHLVVYYSVREPERFVFVQSVEASPYSPLADPSPG